MTDTSSIIAGNRLALSRLLTQIENDTTQGRAALNELFPHTGKAHLIGVTGAPGTGKSSLVNRLAYFYRHPPQGQEARRVAVVAVDPSSPFSGGAVLGDRVRMKDLAGDPGVFIRSMASRGSLGGLATATAGIVQAFDAAGFEVIVIETVGAGQAEVDIARLAHTTLVVEAPGLGDDIQAIKAGILEIADILVVNKADRPGIEQTERALRNMLQLAHPTRRIFSNHCRVEVDEEELASEPIWEVPLVRTVASDGTGVEELLSLFQAHREYLENTGELHRRECARLANEVHLRVQTELMEDWWDHLEPVEYEAVLAKVVAREISPQESLAYLINGHEL